MNKLLTTFRQIWHTHDLRKKIIFTLFILVIFRLSAHVSIPGVDLDRVRSLLENSGDQSLLKIFSLLSGGALENFSIILMGLTPFINASIVL